MLITGFEDTTALEDKKGLTVFSAKPVVVWILIVDSIVSVCITCGCEDVCCCCKADSESDLIEVVEEIAAAAAWRALGAILTR